MSIMLDEAVKAVGAAILLALLVTMFRIGRSERVVLVLRRQPVQKGRSTVLDAVFVPMRALVAALGRAVRF